MSKPLEDQCFEDGEARRLKKLAAAGAGRTAMSALRQKELGAIGETIFRQMKAPASPLQGLKSVMLPGYGQMGALKHLIASYPSMLRNAAPVDRPMVRKMFQQQLQQAFTGIGEVAEPKLKFWRTTAPLLGGGTAGMGLGLAGGAAAGAVNRQQDVESRLAKMPLWDRMKYLVLPQSLNVRPQLPYELRPNKSRQVPERI
jgi:hypothetical protein